MRMVSLRGGSGVLVMLGFEDVSVSVAGGE